MHLQMTYVDKSMEVIQFHTQSGILTVVRAGEVFNMNFPSRMPKSVEQPALIEETLGCSILETHLSRDLFV